MKRFLTGVVLLCALIFSGCSRIFDGSYSSVTPHTMPSAAPTVQEKYAAKDRDELYAVVEKLVHNGLTGAVIDVSAYDKKLIGEDAQWVSAVVLTQDAIAAYAVEEIRFESGTSNNKPVLSVTVDYLAERSQIRSIQYVNNTQTAAAVIRQSLDRCEERVVMYIHDYEQVDFEKIVEDYATIRPQMVMEVPQVTAGVYPEEGMTRVVELQFRYQTEQKALLTMQEQVSPVFESAMLYVSGQAEPLREFEQLGAFLMERFDYQIATSVTPTYSLLCQGVGDSRAFAVTYAAMCSQAGLECVVVSGEKEGQSHYWNIVCADGVYYHVDLMREEFLLRVDAQMGGYAWDRQSYPVCDGPQIDRATGIK